ncbi:hypothetical protein [Blastococcus montanus]|uniref:hypothetical protein n=1 Tax=Blastococcus montanus TaxID=3144973 RepID=UPI003208D945
MTTPSPTSPTEPTTTPKARKRNGDDAPATDAQPAGSATAELEELARTREEAEDRAREMLATQVLQAARDDDGSEDERARQLVLAVRRDLLVELRAQEQEQARRQLAAAADSSEDAVTGVVEGVVTIVRSLVPAALVRPEEVIETTYALADQGLRVTRRLALSLTASMRSLITT